MRIPPYGGGSGGNDGVVDLTKFQGAGGFADACATSSATKKPIWAPPGIYEVDTPINGDDYAYPLTFAFNAFGTSVGSDNMPVTLRATFDSDDYMFSGNLNRWSFAGLSVEAVGTCKGWLDVASGQNIIIDNVHAVLANGTDGFTEAWIKSDGNNFGYSGLSNIRFEAAAPVGILFAGVGSSNGVTPLTIGGTRNIITNVATKPVEFIKIENEYLEPIAFYNTTFNSYGGSNFSAVAMDNLSTLEGLLLVNCEVDYESSLADQRFMKLNNCQNFTCIGGTQSFAGGMDASYDMNGAGMITGFFGTKVFGANKIFNQSANYRIYRGMNNMNFGNVGRFCNDTPGTGSATIVTPTGANWIIEGAYGETAGSVYEFHKTTNEDWNIFPAHPDINVGTFMVEGQIVHLTIFNETADVIPAPNFLGTFIVAAGGWTMPATGTNNTMSFKWSNGKLRQISAVSPDIPNA